MPGESKAVFLSYASEDSEAAQRIADSLKAAGVEVWFDKSELRGGDAWDRKIRRQIYDCRLFMPIVSARTESRIEGYFRREWKLAVDRTHDMSDRATFLVPVVIDATSESSADVPDAFRAVQWIRLSANETSTRFVERIVGLLAASGAETGLGPDRPTAARPSTHLTRRRWLGRIASAVAAFAVAAVAYFWYAAPTATRSVATKAPVAASSERAFDPPPHSVAVLPFENLSSDRGQDYFSEGLAEEILDSLAHVPSLRVAARTSAFALRNEGLDVPAIARRLNVGAILEGSVRRAGPTVRVTAQLIDARTGYHIWSQSFDQTFVNILTIQSSIAKSVATHLDAALSGLALSKFGDSSTRNTDAYDAFLRGIHLLSAAVTGNDFAGAAAAFKQATKLDSRYAAAYAMLAHATAVQFTFAERADQRRRLGEAARVAADRAVELAPTLPEAFATRGFVHDVALLDFSDGADFERAIALAPNNALAIARSSVHQDLIGNPAAAVQGTRRAIQLDPENMSWRSNLVLQLTDAAQYDDALSEIAAYEDRFHRPNHFREHAASIFLAKRDGERARTLCQETLGLKSPLYICLALAEHELGDDQTADHYFDLAVQRYGVEGSFGFAGYCAQRGRADEALEWLREAVAARVPELQELRGAWFLDPLRSDPRFHAIEAALHLPPKPTSLP